MCLDSRVRAQIGPQFLGVILSEIVINCSENVVFVGNTIDVWSGSKRAEAFRTFHQISIDLDRNVDLTKHDFHTGYL